MARDFGSQMAVTAVEAHLSGVQLMGEIDRLNRRVTFDPANGRGDQPCDERGNQSDSNNDGQVESDLLVQTIPVRFHATSPWLWKISGLTLVLKSMLPNLVNRSQVRGSWLEAGTVRSGILEPWQN